ncbi:LOW QUALITY PROTEIN: hypothetical protein V2J09_024348 [Rumex salicifolius]
MARNSSLRFVVVCGVLVAFSILPSTEGLWLNLPSSGTKCVSEEIQNNVVVLADYAVIKEDGQSTLSVSAKVTSPYGNTIYHKENVTYGQFAFTTNEVGNYLACFWVDGHEGASLNLDWKIGVNAKDWDSVAKKEKIEGVELELKKLEGAVEAIHENLIYLKHRYQQILNSKAVLAAVVILTVFFACPMEEDMREVSEKTNARVAWFSILSLGVCITASGLQLLYLKRYFRKKKLI